MWVVTPIRRYSSYNCASREKKGERIFIKNTQCREGRISLYIFLWSIHPPRRRVYLAFPKPQTDPGHLVTEKTLWRLKIIAHIFTSLLLFIILSRCLHPFFLGTRSKFEKFRAAPADSDEVSTTLSLTILRTFRHLSQVPSALWKFLLDSGVNKLEK